ncbi:MAG: sugar porter family MFS transporter [Actinomycetales bacterium]|nr:sugar porter family MFS transporter [Actinomycetales bacterium]
MAAASRIPRSALVVALSAATLGIIYGYDGSNVAGAQLYFEDYFGLQDDQAAVETIVTATVYGELIGALAGGFIINRIGRKPSIVGVAIGYVIFCLLCAFSVTPMMLGICRFFLGLTIGVSLIAVPIFVAESVPARIRGATLVAYQVAAVVGIILGYLGALALSGLGEAINWRIMLGLAAVPAVLLIPALLRLPETARWLVLKGRIAEARVSLERTDPDADIDAELSDIQQAISSEKGGRIKEMLRKPYLRATVFVVGLGFFIQITGINATVAYGPKIFQAMGIDTNTESILMSTLVQGIALVAVLASMTVVDRWGRRPILLTGITIMIVSQLAMVLTFATQQGSTFTTGQVVLGFIGLAGINVGFVFGFGALVWVYSSESFPARLRGYGSSAMLGSDLLANIIIAQFFLTILSTIGGAWSFGIFAILAVLAWLFVWRLAPETKGRELEEIQSFWENGGKWPAEQQAGETGRSR